MIIGVLAVAGYDSADKPYVLGTSVFLARGDAEKGGGSEKTFEGLILSKTGVVSSQVGFVFVPGSPFILISRITSPNTFRTISIP